MPFLLKHTFAVPCFLVCLLSAPMQAQAAPVDETKTLTETLSELTEADAALVTELKKLYTVLGRLVGPEEVLTQANTTLLSNRFVAEISDEVKTLLASIVVHQSDLPAQRILDLTTFLQGEMETYSDVYPEAVKAPLRSLQLLIDRALPDTSTQAIGVAATKLNDDITKTTAVADGSVALGELDELRKTLIALERTRYYAALSSRVDEINELLNLAPAERPPMRGGDIQLLQALKGKIDTVLPAARKAGIHVFYASFGRLPNVGGTGGQCDATETARGLCQGQTSCALTTEALGGLCGGRDPAPFLQSHQRGLFVQYVCLNADPNTWRALLSTSARNYAGKPNSAFLRAEGDAIFCQ